MKKKLIIGITGASGVIYGIRLIEHLQKSDVETHLILSESAKQTIEIETGRSVAEVSQMADFVHDNKKMSAPVASGSFLTEGMVVIPCTIKSLSGIAHSYNENLITRAADVTLKEKRKLALVVRETPLHKNHLMMMAQVVDIGAQIIPPFPAFYHHPQTISDIVDQSVGKVLDYFSISHNLFKRWEGI